MNFRSKVVSVFGAGIIALSMVGGVAAQNDDPSGTDSVRVNVSVNKPNGGTVTWNVAVAPDSFGPVTTSLTQINKSEGTLILTVTDNRFNREGWSISMGADDFRGTTKKDETFGIGNFSLTPGAVTVNAGDTTKPTANTITMDREARKVFVANKGTGSGQYTVPLSGTISIPMNTQADTYTTTIAVSGSAAP